MRDLKVGLLSFAHVHAGGYARLLSDTPGVDLLCADPGWKDAAPGEVRGADFARDLGVAYTDSYDALFDWGPDAVVVCSENARHRDLVLRAASEGCAILCEKPMATTVADAEAMVDACDVAGVALMIAYPVRFAPEFVALRTAYEQGALGDLLTVTGTNNGQIPVGSRSWFADPALAGGGSLVDHVVHVADLVDALTGGADAVRVVASTNRILHQDKPQVKAETGGVVVVTYADGLSLAIDCSWSQPDHAPTWGGLTMTVIGTRGNAEIAPFDQRVDGFTEAGGVPGPLWLGYGMDFDRLMLDHFLDAVRTGTHPQPDGRAGLRTVRIVCAAQESASTGSAVTV